ncbi:MAG: HPP family protein [Desulfobulbaceae bacterium]|nr:MAG: HPP family protein [Desulfobulbaceae bacterium]
MGFGNYFRKMKGVTVGPPRPDIPNVLWSWLGAFLGIAAVSFCHYNLLAESDLVMVIGSFGASAVLLYGAINSPLAQPRNLMGGHILSAIIGVFCYQALQGQMWLAAAVAVATAIAVMQLTRTLHPPGGATALIAVIGSEDVHALGYLYALVPAASGALIMLVVALLVNNLAANRQYPHFWR